MTINWKEISYVYSLYRILKTKNTYSWNLHKKVLR